jgi:PAS domain S-box-containing protein
MQSHHGARNLETTTTRSGGFSGPDTSPDGVRTFLAALIESSEDAIISKDLNGIISSWNGGAQRIFGYTAAEIVGQSILKLIPPELHSEEEQILTKVRAGERIEDHATTRIRKNGERFPISITIFPMRDGAGIIIGASND